MKDVEIKIGNRVISANEKPFVIAEMSGNHNQSFEKAIEIVHSAARSGASAIKLQTYTADTLTLDVKSPDFFVEDSNSLWKGEYLHGLYQKAFTPWEWHEPLFMEAKKLGLIYFSSAFDASSVDFLETLDVPAYKIASFENAHLPLIKRVSETGKPVIMSTGMATLEEIEESVTCARDNGCKDLILLKCTSNYPATSMNVNLATMEDLAKRFFCQVGFSDHTLGVGASVSAVAHGAVVIEKHLTKSSLDKGVDSAFSMSEEDFSMLVRECNVAWESFGKITYGPTEEEVPSMKFRRSIYAIKAISKGDFFNQENIGIIRPGFGLHPRFFSELLGSQAKRGFEAGDRLAESDLS